MKKSVIREIANDCNIPFEMAEDGSRDLSDLHYHFADEIAMKARVRDAPCAYACESVAYGIKIKRLENEIKKLKEQLND